MTLWPLLPQRQQHDKDANSQPSSLPEAPSWISQHRARLQGLTGKAEDEGREWDATERNDKVEGGEEKSQIGRLRGERPEYETENWWV